MNVSGDHHAWAGMVEEFLAEADRPLLLALEAHHLRATGEPAGSSQTAAWIDCVQVLRASLRKIIGSDPKAGAWGVIFEYELPRERGRRPDVVILADRAIIVLEFKGHRDPLASHLDQVAAYARDLAAYHAASRDNPVYPVLVLTQLAQPIAPVDGISVSGPRDLSDQIVRFAQRGAGPAIDMARWLEADYAPLPSLVSAARTIFRHEPLPSIRRAQSAGIADTLKVLSDVANLARTNKQRHLALVTGVPGAGKTLVGLQFVYLTQFSEGDAERNGVFLSGNGPLVKVLQHALRSSVFVQDVHGFLRQYGGNSTRLPDEHVWVYDEAQRAWDADRVLQKRQHAASEPEDFLRIGRRMPDWCVMVGLIGEGQEIHLGEEAGLQQWNDAIRAVGGEWTVHCPVRLSPMFGHATHVRTDDRLDLTESLRSHLAEDLQRWVGALLDGRITDAARLAPLVSRAGFSLYVTRSLDEASSYVRERYSGEVDKRFGLIASSRATNLPRWGVQNSFQFTKRLREGPWYNDLPDSRFSCCQLHDVATEFACQGLELDCPIVCWGDDLCWQDGIWRSRPSRRSQARNPHLLRLNSYRVLLSRGRDGMVAFVPPEPAMDATFQVLCNAGMRSLALIGAKAA